MSFNSIPGQILHYQGHKNHTSLLIFHCQPPVPPNNARSTSTLLRQTILSYSKKLDKKVTQINNLRCFYRRLLCQELCHWLKTHTSTKIIQSAIALYFPLTEFPISANYSPIYVAQPILHACRLHSLCLHGCSASEWPISLQISSPKNIASPIAIN